MCLESGMKVDQKPHKNDFLDHNLFHNFYGKNFMDSKFGKKLGCPRKFSELEKWCKNSVREKFWGWKNGTKNEVSQKIFQIGKMVNKLISDKNSEVGIVEV